MDDMKIPFFKPTTPGKMLRDQFLVPLNISQSELAKSIGVATSVVSDLCNDKRRVDAETASLLSAALGSSVQFWLNLQYLTDIWLVKNNKAFQKRCSKVRLLTPVAD